MSETEYRIEYQIQKAVDGGEFEEIGFGSSGGYQHMTLEGLDHDVRLRR